MYALCASCNKILSKLFTNTRTSEGGFGPKYEQHRYTYDLMTSAQECRLCNLIIENGSICDYITPDGLPTVQALSQECYRHMPVVWMLRRYDPFPSISPSIGCRWTRIDVEIEVDDSDMPGFSSNLLLYSRPDSPALIRQDVIGKGALTDSGSNEGLSLLRRWLECCVTTHPKCLQTSSGYQQDPNQLPCLPARVLDIGSETSSQCLRLYETCGHRANYAILSHCWGPSSDANLRTTTYNLKAHLEGIDQGQLSKTYRDSITVARAVGLRYLWIDSLCILQDNLKDWESEAQKMGCYYELSFITIAASATNIGSDGLFMSRPKPGPVLEVPYIDRNGNVDGSFFIAPLNDKADIRRSALWKRAWTTQERILSPRMIHYQEDSLIWSCKEVSHTECGVGLSLDDEAALDWPTLTGYYSHRDISFEKDRLFAIQGLANLVQTRRTDDYIFGMWTADFPEQLFWRRSGDNMTRNVDLPNVPSWSWASRIGGVVTYNPDHTIYDWSRVCEFVNVNEKGAMTLNGFFTQADGFRHQNLAQLGHDWTPIYRDKTSELNWGLGLDGFSLPDEPPPKHLTMLLDGSDFVTGWIALDLDDSVDEVLYFFLLAITELSEIKLCDENCGCNLGSRSDTYPR